MADEERRVVWNLFANFAKARKEADDTTRSFRELEAQEKKTNASSASGSKSATDAQAKRTSATQKLIDGLRQLSRAEAEEYAATHKTATSHQEAEASETKRTASLKGLLSTIGQYAARAQALASTNSKYASTAQAAEAAERQLGRARLAQTSAMLAEEKAGGTLAEAQRKLTQLHTSGKASAEDLERAELKLQVAHLAAARAAQQLSNATHDVDRALRTASGGGGNITNTVKQVGSSFDDVGKGVKQFAGLLSLISFGGIISAIGPLLGLLSALSAGFFALAGAISPAIGILGALPGVFAAAGAGLGALVLGFSGVIGALKAYTAQQKTAAQQAVTGAKTTQTAQEKAITRQQALVRAQQQAQLQQMSNARELRSAQEALFNAQQQQTDEQITDSKNLIDAQRAVSDARQQAAKTAQDDATAIINAQQTVVQAEHDVIVSEHNVIAARQEAKRQIDDLKTSLQDLALQARGAQLDLADAQKNLIRTLNDPNATAEDRQRAQLQLDEAKQRQKELLKTQKDTQKQLADSEKKGIEGSDAVVQAKQQEKQAEDALRQAEVELSNAKIKAADDQIKSNRDIQDSIYNLAQAEKKSSEDRTKNARAVRDAESDLNDTQKRIAIQNAETAASLKQAADAEKQAADAATTGTKKFNQFQYALSNLPVSAQKFVKLLISMRGEFKQLKTVTADNLFPGVTRGLLQANTLFPIFKKGAGEAAKAVGDDFDNLGRTVSSGPFKRDLPKIFASNTVLIHDFGTSLDAILRILLAVTTAAIPFTEWLSHSITLWLQQKAAAAQAAQQNGKMAAFFDKTRHTLSLLWDILKNVAGALIHTGSVGQKTGYALLQSIDNLARRWNDWTTSVQGNQSLQRWYAGARPVLSETSKLIGAIARGLAGLSDPKTTSNFIKQLRTELGPAVEKLLKDLTKGDLGSGIITFLTHFVNLLDTLVANGGGSLNLLITILSDFLQIINTIIQVVPGGTSTLGAFLTVIAVFKIAKLLAMVSGLSSLVKVILNFRKASAGLQGATGLGAILANLFGGSGGKAAKSGQLSLFNDLEKGAKTGIGRIGTIISAGLLLPFKSIFLTILRLATTTFSGLGNIIGGAVTKIFPSLAGAADKVGKAIGGKGGGLGGALRLFGSTLAGIVPEAIGVALPLAAIGGAMLLLDRNAREHAIPSFAKIDDALARQFNATGNNVQGYNRLSAALLEQKHRADALIPVYGQEIQMVGNNTQAQIALNNEIVRQNDAHREAVKRFEATRQKLALLTTNANILAGEFGITQGSALRLADAFGIDLSSSSQKTDQQLQILSNQTDATAVHLGLGKVAVLNMANAFGINLASNSAKTAIQLANVRLNARDIATQFGITKGEAVTLAAEFGVNLAGSVQSVNSKLSVLANALLTFGDNARASQGAADGFQLQLNGLAAQVKQNSLALQGNSDKAISNRQYLTQLAQAAVQHATAVFNQTGNIKQARQALLDDEKALQSNGQKVGFNRGQLDLFLGSIGALPGQADKALAHLTNLNSQEGRGLEGLTKHPWLIQINANAKWSADQARPNSRFPVLQQASGGFIRGPGGPRTDSIPAMLSNGEYVINAAATRAYKPLLDRINYSKGQAFAEGGPVGKIKGYFQGGPVEIDASISGDAFGATTSDWLTGKINTLAQAVAAAMSDTGEVLGAGAGEAMLDYAKRFIGIPYIWGGSDPHGFDCSGLTSYVMRHFGLNPPRTAAEQKKWAVPEPKSAALPGDLVFWGDPAHHVAFFMGGNSILEAPQPGDIIKIASLYDGPTFGRERGLDALNAKFGAKGGASRWASTVSAVLSELKQPQNLVPWVLSLIAHESGGNPRAINLSDSNARRGDPSRGLMQTIGSTFNAYAGLYKKLGIFDPYANIYAGLNYGIARYGSVANIPGIRSMRHGGPYLPYSTGGVVPGYGEHDTVPAMLTPGEFVLNKKAVQRMGLSRLHAINGTTPGQRGSASGDVQYFHEGGPVDGFKKGGHGPFIRAIRWEEGLGQNWKFQGWDSNLTRALQHRYPKHLGKVPDIDVSRLIKYLLAIKNVTATFSQVASHFDHNHMMSPIQVIQSASAMRGNAAKIDARALAKLTADTQKAYNHLAYLESVHAQRGNAKVDRAGLLAIKKQREVAAEASRKLAETKRKGPHETLWDQVPVKQRAIFLKTLSQASGVYHQDIKSMQHHMAMAQTGVWSSGADPIVAHVINHALGRKHDKWAPRPWKPLTAAEVAEQEQERSNKLTLEFDGYLETFAGWGLKALVDKLLELGPADGMEIARSAVKNRKVATDLNAAYAKAAKLNDPETQKNMLYLISLLSTSKSPVGLRNVAMNLQIPDYGVVQLWDSVGDEVRKKIPKAKLEKLLGDIASFRAGTFYAAEGGMVPGAGDTDSVPAMLTPGEFVLRKAAVRALGLDRLMDINDNPWVQAFANGGFVMATPDMSLPTPALSRIGGGSSGSEPRVVNYNYTFETDINNPVGENSVASLNAFLRRKAALGALPGGE